MLRHDPALTARARRCYILGPSQRKNEFTRKQGVHGKKKRWSALSMLRSGSSASHRASTKS